MTKQVLILLFLLLGACVSKTIQPTILHLTPVLAEKDLLFPYGNYRHHVDLHILKTENGKDARFSFDGVAATSESAIHLVILSSFATTLMKIDENRGTGEVKIETYEPRIRPYAGRFGEYYEKLRKIMVLGAKERPPENVTLSKVEGGIPRHIQVKEANYELQIEVEPVRQ